MKTISFAQYLIEMETLMNQAESDMDPETLRCFLAATRQKIKQLEWLWLD